MMLKQRYEPAETFSMAEDGFFGELYLPAHNAFPGKCLILFGGSAGKFLLTQLVAEQFVARTLAFSIAALSSSESG